MEEVTVNEGRNRDNKGRFVKGHRLFSDSNGVRNGRKRCATTEALEVDALIAKDHLPIMRLQLAEYGVETEDMELKLKIHDRLSDRIQGRPTERHEIGNLDGMPFASRVEIGDSVEGKPFREVSRG